MFYMLRNENENFLRVLFRRECGGKISVARRLLNWILSASMLITLKCLCSLFNLCETQNLLLISWDFLLNLFVSESFHNFSACMREFFCCCCIFRQEELLLITVHEKIAWMYASSFLLVIFFAPNFLYLIFDSLKAFFSS